VMDVIDYDSFIQMAFVDIFDYQISYILMQVVLFVRFVMSFSGLE